MINGATKIIANVPGKYLDPFLLVQSQVSDSVGYVVIAYQSTGPEASVLSSRFFDLLFFRGPAIFEFIRMNQDLRFYVDPERIRETFRSSGKDESRRISLFLTTEATVHCFQSTIHYEPCLKIPVRAISSKRITALLQNAGCHRGIIECNDFTQELPLLELIDVKSAEDISRYRPIYKNGNMILYNTERNKDLVTERHRNLSSRQPMQGRSMGTEYPAGSSTVHIIDSNADQDIGKSQEPSATETADEFTKLIRTILDTSNVPDLRPNRNPTHADNVHRTTEPKTESRLVSKEPNVDNGQGSSSSKSGRKKVLAGRERKLPSRSPRVNGPESLAKQADDIPSNEENATESTADTQTAVSGSTGREEVVIIASSDFTRMFQRLFRSFRQQVFECYGDRSEAVISLAEKKIRFVTPEFELRSLSDRTSVIVLDLVETITNDAPFFKRSKLRTAGLTLVADLYNKQYDSLEHHGVIDKVEQFYYRLKR